MEFVVDSRAEEMPVNQKINELQAGQVVLVTAGAIAEEGWKGLNYSYLLQRCLVRFSPAHGHCVCHAGRGQGARHCRYLSFAGGGPAAASNRP
jgi:hypothetical protein